MAAVSRLGLYGGARPAYAAFLPASDTTPDPFTFVDVVDQDSGALITSNTITVAGINAASDVTFVETGHSSGLFSKNGGAFIDLANTTVVDGDTLALQLTSSGSQNTKVSITVTIGGVSDTWDVTTILTAGGDPWGAWEHFAYYRKKYLDQETGKAPSIKRVSRETDVAPLRTAVEELVEDTEAIRALLETAKDELEYRNLLARAKELSEVDRLSAARIEQLKTKAEELNVVVDLTDRLSRARIEHLSAKVEELNAAVALAEMLKRRLDEDLVVILAIIAIFF